VDPSGVRDHHVKLEYCYTRPRYREGRLERSVKVVASRINGAKTPFVVAGLYSK